jgi:predicted outer membrane protein
MPDGAPPGHGVITPLVRHAHLPHLAITMIPAFHVCLVTCIMIGAMLAKGADDVKARALTAGEAAFLKAAAASVALESRLARLAVRQGGAIELKAYAGRLILDQRLLSIEIKGLTTQEFRSEAVMLREEDVTLLHRLETCELAAFDAVMLDELIRSHQAALASFEAQCQDGAGIHLKDFVLRTFLRLRAHRDMVAWFSTK